MRAGILRRQESSAQKSSGSNGRRLPGLRAILSVRFGLGASCIIISRHTCRRRADFGRGRGVCLKYDTWRGIHTMWVRTMAVAFERWIIRFFFNCEVAWQATCAQRLETREGRFRHMLLRPHVRRCASSKTEHIESTKMAGEYHVYYALLDQHCAHDRHLDGLSYTAQRRSFSPAQLISTGLQLHRKAPSL